MITERDDKILSFIEDMNIATTKQIAALFFPGASRRRCQQRMSMLTAACNLHRCRESASMDYLYYAGRKSVEVRHMLARGNAYIQIIQNYDLVDFRPEYSLGDLRADAYFEIRQNGCLTGYFLEIQLSPHFDQRKYENAYSAGKWTEYWDGFPEVIVITNKNVRLRKGSVTFKVFNLNEAISL